jgi:drug/metabolite transporter (DMT)-like permease
MFEKYKFHILLHAIILMWGFTGILGKLIHLDALYLVWHRVAIALIGLLLYVILTKKSFRIHSKIEFAKIAGVGVLVALHWLFFYKSIQLSTASLGILCLSTTTLHVAWLEPLVMKRKFSWLELVLGLVVIYGIYFVSSDFKANDFEALIYGLFAALFAALFSVFNGKIVQNTPSYKMSFYELLTALVFLSLVMVFNGTLNTSLFEMSVSDFLWLLFLGLLCTSFAFLATIEVVKKLGAFTVSLSINLEPVYTILLAIFLLHEHTVLGKQFYIGSLIIIFVVIANPILRYYFKKR